MGAEIPIGMGLDCLELQDEEAGGGLFTVTENSSVLGRTVSFSNSLSMGI